MKTIEASVDAYPVHGSTDVVFHAADTQLPVPVAAVPGVAYEMIIPGQGSEQQKPRHPSDYERTFKDRDPNGCECGSVPIAAAAIVFSLVHGARRYANWRNNR